MRVVKELKDNERLEADNLEGVIVGKALYDGRVTYQALVAAAGGK